MPNIQNLAVFADCLRVSPSTVIAGFSGVLSCACICEGPGLRNWAGIIMPTNAMIPIILNACCQSKEFISNWASTGQIAPPRAIPIIPIEMASPLFAVNQRGIVELTGTIQQLMATAPRTPHSRYTCHRAVTSAIPNITIPVRTPVMVTSKRGPNLSVSLPVTIAKSPPRKAHIEKAADKAPRSHWNCSARGSRKILKVPVRVPSATRITR